MKITDKLNDKKILIWGYGREGKSTEQFLKNYCQPKEVSVFIGTQDELNEEPYDYIIKSPGIKTKTYNEKYISQTDLFLEEFSGQTVGITGTKGKSTTSSMLAGVLSKCLDRNVLLVGNIGLPCLDYYGEIDADTVIVYEMSCHQLCHAYLSPHVGVFLNLFEEHLDYYGTVENYFRAKANITANQKADDFFYAGENVPEIPSAAKRTTIPFVPERTFEMKLRGTHNQYNAGIVFRICTEVFGCDEAAVTAAIADFEGLHHRMEFLGEKDGVEYFDDSISTIPEATIAAAGSIANAKTLLIGGMDRGINYDILVDFIKNHEEYNYILMYESGKRIYDQVSDCPTVHYCDDLEKTVRLAKEITPGGKACILSPAAASYGYFKNFEERGDVFKALALGTVLAFTGDIGFDRYMEKMWEDDAFLDPAIVEYLTAADHVVANVEGAMVDGTMELVQCAEMRLMHTIDPAATGVLRTIHADIWNLCNNHIMDCGPEGLRCSLQEAEKFGAKTIGAGMDLSQAAKPLILDEAGGIGLFGVGYQRGCKPAGPEKAGCLDWSDMETIQKVISEIKSKCRWCVVVAHGGEEFTSLPSPYTRDRYHAYLDMGADLVVSHHPHVPMNYETVGEKTIFYSLGNFIFDTDYQRAQFNTDIGILTRIHFTEDSYSWDACGIRIDRTNEHILRGELPRIFTDVQEEEYQKLIPLACKMFVAATKRQQIYMFPKQYSENTTEEEWHENFWRDMRSGRVPGQGLDFQIICPIADKAEEGAWKESKLEEVKAYILEQM